MVHLLRESPRPAAVRDHPLAPWFAVGTVCFGAFMGQLDASIVTVTFPALQRQYGAGLAAVQWVSLAYLLALTAVIVPAGRWSDRAGRKLFYLYGFVAFAVTSAACGLAPSLGALIGLRVLQAAAATLLQANSVALVVTSVPGQLRRKALGVQAAAQALGLAAGPVTGGLVVATVGWRWVFFINVPVGLVAVVLGWFLLPRTHARQEKTSSDLGGVGLLVSSTVAGMLAISALSGLGWPGWAIAGCAVVAGGAGVALRWQERRVRAPLLDFDVLKTGGAARGLLGALCSYLVLFGPLVLFPQLVTDRGGSALSAGLLLTSLPAGFGGAAVVADRLLPANWSNARRCVLGGVLSFAAAAALVVPAPDVVSVVLLGLLGVGLGIYTPANNAEVMSVLPDTNAATAGGMVNMTRGIGTALGVAVVTLGLHAGQAYAGGISGGRAIAMAVIAAAALTATWAGLGASPRGTGQGRGAAAGTVAEAASGELL